MYPTCCYRIFYVDADAASTNIQLNLRVLPDKHCKQFRSYEANSYHNNKKGDESSDEEDDDDDSVDEVIKDHNTGCGCRTCNWTKMFNLD